MDPTTLIAGAVVAFGLLAADIVIYSGSVVVEVAAPPKTDTMEIDQTIVQGEFSALIRSDLQAYAKLIREAKIPAQ